MDSNDQQETRPANHDHGEQKGWVADAAPIAAPTILAAGQIIAAKISNGKDKGDGKS